MAVKSCTNQAWLSSFAQIKHECQVWLLLGHKCSSAMHSEAVHPGWNLTLHVQYMYVVCTVVTATACAARKMLGAVQLHTASGSTSADCFKTALLCKCLMIATLQANSIVALDLDTGDISWSVQLGPLESWVYSCISSAALNLNLSGVDIYLWALNLHVSLQNHVFQNLANCCVFV